MLNAVSRNCFQNGFGRGVIAESLAHMRQVVNIAGTKDKASAKLQGIFTQFFLAMSSSFGPLAGERIILAQEVKQ